MALKTKDLENRLQERIESGGERAARLETDLDTRRSQFDARERVREASQADFEDFRQFFGEDMERLRESQVQRGRLGSGGGFRDEDRLFREQGDLLNRRVAQRAVQTAGLDLRNIEGLGGDAALARNLDLELLTGSHDRATARENFERERKKKKGGFLGGLLGGAAGFLLGGPVGAVTGSRIGGQIADIFV